jgi:uncharacterized membrane protein YfcA
VAAAAFVKGAIGFGFPTLGTPLLALVVDVKTAVVALILPNIVMDGVQAARRGDVAATVRRFAPLIVAGAAGTWVGTYLLVLLPGWVAMLALGGFVLVFVGLNLARLAPRIEPAWEHRLGGLVGFLTGVLGGLTNVPGTPLVIYFYALGLAKQDFVRAVAVTFVAYKMVQLGAVAYYGLLTWRLLVLSSGLCIAALGGFAVGLRVQDRLDQQTFNRAVLTFLGLLGLWLVIRSLR